jgi:hypothetical protein
VDYIVVYDDEDCSACMSIINPDVVFTGLFNSTEESRFIPKTDKTEKIEHPFEPKSSNKKMLNTKYFDLG